MFEALETGKRLTPAKFRALRDQLRPALLEQQFALREQNHPVIILLGGLDGSGRGAVSHRLNEWMDPRYIDTNAFWQHSDEEEGRPYHWRFWRRMPPRGETAIMIGSWYSEPAYDAMAGNMGSAAFHESMRDIDAFERMLTNDGTLLIKIWLHVSRKTQRLQLAEESPQKQQNPRVPGDPDEWWKRYPDAIEVSGDMLRSTDTSYAPWHLVEAEDANYRDISVAELVLRRMQGHQPPANDTAVAQESLLTATQPTILDTVDLSRTLARDVYDKRLRSLQKKLQNLAWKAHRQHRSLVAVFEGWDAAGKGSAIRRVTAAIDPRLYKLYQYAAPSDEERAQHYLWRFWRHLQRDGRATLFDRSWYGRVLVERVEGFATPGEWNRAYGEINHFERQLTDHGSIVVKFWLHISPEEQLHRFEDRASKPHKQHKITEDDWRNREKWSAYARAVEDMVANTSSSHAPWTLVAGNDKPYARIQILEHICATLKAALKK